MSILMMVLLLLMSKHVLLGRRLTALGARGHPDAASARDSARDYVLLLGLHSELGLRLLLRVNACAGSAHLEHHLLLG